MNFVRVVSLPGPTSESLGLSTPRRKWPISYRSVGIIAVALDIVAIMTVGVLTGVLYNIELFGTADHVLSYFGAAAVVTALFVSVMKSHNLYAPTELLALRTQIGRAATTWASVFLFLSGAAFALKIGDQFSRGSIFSFAAIGLVLLIVQRVLYREVLTRGLAGAKFSGRNAILITDETPTEGNMLVQNLLKHGFRLNHLFVFPIHQQVQQDSLIADVISYLRESDIQEVIVSVDTKHWGGLAKLFSGLRSLPLPVSLVPVGAASEILSRPSHVMGDSICIELQREPLDALERGVKRSIDILVAFSGLVLLMPLLALTAVMIKLDSAGPIFFRQRRCGFNGREFEMVKFRTMSVLEDGTEVAQAKKFDSRVTRLGKLLRRTSIDELPQLLNVLRGSMSLVGPRPHAVAHDDHFDKIVSNYAFRRHVKPGVTGWAQVNGFRGPTPNLAAIQNRVEYDLWYIDNWSLHLDFLIICRTILEVARGRNAY